MHLKKNSTSSGFKYEHAPLGKQDQDFEAILDSTEETTESFTHDQFLRDGVVQERRQHLY